jgi:hypothetical protein
VSVSVSVCVCVCVCVCVSHARTRGLSLTHSLSLSHTPKHTQTAYTAAEGVVPKMMSVGNQRVTLSGQGFKPLSTYQCVLVARKYTKEEVELRSYEAIPGALPLHTHMHAYIHTRRSCAHMRPSPVPYLCLLPQLQSRVFVLWATFWLFY